MLSFRVGGGSGLSAPHRKRKRRKERRERRKKKRRRKRRRRRWRLTGDSLALGCWASQDLWDSWNNLIQSCWSPSRGWTPGLPLSPHMASTMGTGRGPLDPGSDLGPGLVGLRMMGSHPLLVCAMQDISFLRMMLLWRRQGPKHLCDSPRLPPWRTTKSSGKGSRCTTVPIPSTAFCSSNVSNLSVTQ